jgi:cytochrome c-type biogenesis protein
MLGWLKLSFLYRIRGFQNVRRRPGVFGSFVLGAAISFGWLPCIGPVLGTILTLAAAQETVAQGVVLLVVYSLGLAVPFFLAAIAIRAFLSTLRRMRHYIRAVEVTAGVVLLVLGTLLFSDRMTMLIHFLPQWDFGGRL